MWELVLRAPRELVEAVGDQLADECGALAVSVEDADADTEDEEPIFGEPGEPPPAPAWQHSTLKALFDDEAAAEAAAARLLAAPGHGRVRLLALDEIAEQDWVRLTQSQFEAVPVTPGFWIVPSWQPVPAAATCVIHLDPGLAFGTGTHPTTRMCLRWIAARAASGEPVGRVLDYGCGSGILAIAAALHGAAEVHAVDIDEAAVQATRANAQSNRVAILAGTPEMAVGRYQWVLANILARPLELLAPLLAAHVAAGGHLVLAGLLARQAEHLAAVYAPWLTLEVGDEEEGWVLLSGRAAARPPMA